MQQQFGDYEIDDDRARLDFGRVHSWLTATYWSPGIERDKVERAAASSTLAIGCYDRGDQVGYARVVSDTVRFAYVADVYVDEQHRGRGIASAIVKFAQAHPAIADVKSILLATRDAHQVYMSVGFSPLSNPEIWMTWVRPDKNDHSGEQSRP